MKTILLSILFVGGIALAGNSGPWFPAPNILGVIMIGAVALCANRMEMANAD